MRLTVFLAAAAFAMLSDFPATACTGCGCRGGPGYRGPDGRCVGFASLKSICGDPPETRCKKEGSSGAGCKGGPGYRKLEDHQCAGWGTLKRDCGDPPTQRCLYEGVPIGGSQTGNSR